MNLDDESQPASDPTVAKLAELAGHRLGEMSDLQHARGLHGVMAGFTRASGAPGGLRSRRAWRFGAGAAAALGVAVLIVWPRLSALVVKPPLTFAMTQGELQAGGYFRSGAQVRSAIQFSDGTQVALVAGARGRIATVDARGARVTLDEGEAHVAVVPRLGARWQFDAGPFVVHVQGTEFGLAWKGDEGRLDVRLHKGSVTVTGPLSAEVIALHPGQWLTVRLAAREVFVREFDRAASAALSGDATATPAATTPATRVPGLAPPAPAPAPAGGPARTRRPLHASPAQPASPDLAWGPARAEGDWNRILDLATQRGLDRTLAERSSEDLALLADAAYYLRRDDIAERALLAQRQRFPGSTRAKDAAFLLGRIVEAKVGGASAALDWYDRHLEEAPNGAYASEALGRKLTVLARLHGKVAARPVAAEYLRRYPGGSYARAARAYVELP